MEPQRRAPRLEHEVARNVAAVAQDNAQLGLDVVRRRTLRYPALVDQLRYRHQLRARHLHLLFEVGHDAVELGGLSLEELHLLPFAQVGDVELHGRLSVGGGVLGPIALLALLFRLADRECVEKVLFVQELQLLDLQFGALPGL